MIFRYLQLTNMTATLWLEAVISHICCKQKLKISPWLCPPPTHTPFIYVIFFNVNLVILLYFTFQFIKPSHHFFMCFFFFYCKSGCSVVPHFSIHQGTFSVFFLFFIFILNLLNIIFFFAMNLNWHIQLKSELQNLHLQKEVTQ